MANDKRPNRDARDEEQDQIVEAPDMSEDARNEAPNPPRTTAGGWTSPKFGSAGSGGLEYEGNFPVD